METKKPIVKPAKPVKLSLIQKWKQKNWKADRQAFKAKWKDRFMKWKPYAIIITWYTLLFYAFMAFLFKDYSWRTLLFAFALYFVYEKLRDDYIEVQELKSTYERENNK
jgi:hypothetical protein